MRITLTLYPRFEPPIELVIECVPALDGSDVEGLWDVDTNRVASPQLAALQPVQ